MDGPEFWKHYTQLPQLPQNPNPYYNPALAHPTSAHPAHHPNYRQDRQELHSDIGKWLQYSNSFFSLLNFIIQESWIFFQHFILTYTFLSPGKMKRKRTQFNTEQVNILEAAFLINCFVDAAKKDELSRTTGVPPTTVGLW